MPPDAPPRARPSTRGLVAVLTFPRLHGLQRIEELINTDDTTVVMTDRAQLAMVGRAVMPLLSDLIVFMDAGEIVLCLGNGKLDWHVLRELSRRMHARTWLVAFGIPNGFKLLDALAAFRITHATPAAIAALNPEEGPDHG